MPRSASKKSPDWFVSTWISCKSKRTCCEVGLLMVKFQKLSTGLSGPSGGSDTWLRPETLLEGPVTVTFKSTVGARLAVLTINWTAVGSTNVPSTYVENGFTINDRRIVVRKLVGL